MEIITTIKQIDAKARSNFIRLQSGRTTVRHTHDGLEYIVSKGQAWQGDSGLSSDLLKMISDATNSDKLKKEIIKSS